MCTLTKAEAVKVTMIKPNTSHAFADVMVAHPSLRSYRPWYVQLDFTFQCSTQTRVSIKYIEQSVRDVNIFNFAFLALKFGDNLASHLRLLKIFYSTKHLCTADQLDDAISQCCARVWVCVCVRACMCLLVAHSIYLEKENEVLFNDCLVSREERSSLRVRQTNPAI